MICGSGGAGCLLLVGGASGTMTGAGSVGIGGLEVDEYLVPHADSKMVDTTTRDNDELRIPVSLKEKFRAVIKKVCSRSLTSDEYNTSI